MSWNCSPENCSPETEEFEPNYAGYFQRIFTDVLDVEDLLPDLDSRSGPNMLSGQEKGYSWTDDDGVQKHQTAVINVPFADGLGKDFSDDKKEKVRGVLHEAAAVFNDEIDSIIGEIMAMLQYEQQPDEEGKAPPICDKKREVSSPESSDFSPSEATVERVYGVISAYQKAGKTLSEAVNQFSAGLAAKLCKVEDGIEEFLREVVSRCRPMKRTEKHQLGKRIRQLPEKSLSRIVEIISTPGSNTDLMSIELEELDNATLWRLCYYAEAVLRVSRR